jgi:hypothetical protein
LLSAFVIWEEGDPFMTKRRRTESIARPPGGLHLEVEKAVRGSTDHQVSDTRARAQELALNALSATDTTEQLELAVKAVVLDPRCTDGLVLLAEIFESLDDYVEAMYLIVMRAAEDLGTDMFQRERGRFWEMLETRPYMRARLHLALALDEAGMISQATAEFEGLLELNASDNLGARFPLLSLYVEAGKLDSASALLSRFPDDQSAQFIWIRLLLTILASDSAAAETGLHQARKRNTHVEGYLNGTKHLPEKPPEAYSTGDPNEAISCAFEIHDAWQAHPAAVEWLKGHEVVVRQRKSKKRE